MCSPFRNPENPGLEESPAVSKLRRFPPIPLRQKTIVEGNDSGNKDSDAGNSNILGPSTLGLNQIRTRSLPLPLEQEDLESQENDEAVSIPKQSAATSIEQGGIGIAWSSLFIFLWNKSFENLAYG